MPPLLEDHAAAYRFKIHPKLSQVQFTTAQPHKSLPLSNLSTAENTAENAAEKANVERAAAAADTQDEDAPVGTFWVLSGPVRSCRDLSVPVGTCRGMSGPEHWGCDLNIVLHLVIKSIVIIFPRKGLWVFPPVTSVSSSLYLCGGYNFPPGLLGCGQR